YKAMWSKRDGFPPDDYFAALHPRLEHVVDEKLSRTIAPMGERAGVLTTRAAALTGLRPGTPVAVANVDAHVSAPAATVTEPGTMVVIMGTSNCHILLGDRLAVVEGMCGVVEDGVVPGLFGYEAGQSAVGDIFGWFIETVGGTPEPPAGAAAGLRPGESGLLALDCWNGHRSVLVDADLTGLVVGMDLGTTAPEIYRALLEATAFGTRVIVEAFESAGVPVERIVACGGLPERNRLLMQIHAGVTGRDFSIAASGQAPALGSAMFGAVAGGVHGTIGEAAGRMARLGDDVYRPVEAHHAVYDELYGEYVRLYDLFGRTDGLMK